MTPGARRRGGIGETIGFVTVETPLGWALVAATERGVCMTALADDPESLEASLQQRFPAAKVIAEDGQLNATSRPDWCAVIGRCIHASDSHKENWLARR